MKNLITFLFLVIFLSYNYLENGRVSSKLFLSDEINSKLEEKSKKILVDGIYFLYRKCNLNNKKCHQLYPIKKMDFIF